MSMKLKKDKKNLFSHLFIRNGVTLVEIMIAMSLLSIGVLGMIGSFAYLNKGLQVTKGRTLANNLAQEKIELLKNKSYYRVLVTTETDKNYDPDPLIEYDIYPNGMEEIGAGGINFKRYVYIRKIAEDTNGDLIYFNWNQPDTGLKEIEVHVVWQEGGDWKQLKLINIRENPDRSFLSASFTGEVLDNNTGNPIEGVTVKAIENPARVDSSDGTGEYSFVIEPGSYTLRASKEGYFPALSETYSIEASEALDEPDFKLVEMDFGTISGTVYKRDHLVISQVVASTEDAGCFQEWIEVYNPTTWTWTMATGLNSGVIGVAYQLRTDASATVIPLDYFTFTLAPQHYYLFANRATITVAGSTVNADAVYTAGGCTNVIKINTDGGNDAAGVGLGWVNVSPAVGMDAVGWSTGGLEPSMKEEPPLAEVIGFQANEMYVRRTGPGVMTGGDARTYDSNNNINDFAVFVGVVSPKNSSDTEVPTTGTPAEGAIVYADDGLSNSVVADSDGNFNLINVATGAWTVYISSDTLFLSTKTYGGTVNGFTDSLNETLISSSTLGYIMGRVTDVNDDPIENIEVYGSGSLNPALTDSDGEYTLAMEPDTVLVTANYQLANSQYVEASSMSIVVETGLMVQDVDFVLSEGGNISGWVTTNGVDPLPDTPIVAFKGGVAQGDGITDGDGYYYIKGLSSGAYVVEPQLENGETSSPATYTEDPLEASEDIFVGTFTVSGAMGYIIGDVSVDGEIIDTGVLIYASTDTIASTPPTLNSTLRSGSVIYYAVSSNFDGTYRLAVRGGYTYNVYAWYVTWSGQTPTIQRDEHEGVDAVTLAAGEIVERDFSW
jgi:prepilin-type N-terminal cleavage/methylation domain-containing protein